MDQNRMNELLERYLSGVIDEADASELYIWFNQVSQEEFERTINACINIPAVYKEPAVMKESFQKELESRLDLIDEEEALTSQNGRLRVLASPWLKYAAMVLVCLGLGWAGYIIYNKGKKSSQSGAISEAVILPGRKGAILKLADGKMVQLDSLNNGQVAVQNGTEVVLNNDQLAYKAGDASTVSYNTMFTPRGREFHLLLPDGTHVWLNAESSITYPTAFTEQKREVSISGELYFEVAKDASKPFIVKVDKGAEVRVLGTHFNINAYKDDGLVKTTLLEGKVQLRAGDESQQLQPGQQAQLNAYSKIKLINEANITEVMAWKNGLFNFSGSNVKIIMLQIARWYDLQVEYENIPEPGEIIGGIDRNLTLSQVINVLKKINIKCHLEGRKLIVTK